MDSTLRALADGTRRHILTLVSDKECTASEIASEFSMSRPAISQHIKVLLNSDLIVLYNAKATNGDHPILGIDFWSLTDSGPGESTNWGLMSDRDNAYDGRAATIALGTDQWGFATGGEDRNYGDFLDEVTQTNLSTVKQFIVESH